MSLKTVVVNDIDISIVGSSNILFASQGCWHVPRLGEIIKLWDTCYEVKQVMSEFSQDGDMEMVSIHVEEC